MKTKIFAILFLLVVLMPTVALAQTVSNPCSSVNIKAADDLTKSLPKCINQIYVWSLGVSVVFALLMIVLGGYYYMTSAGNAEQAEKGKTFITSSLVAVVLLFSAYLLLREINPNLVDFRIGNPQCVDSSGKLIPNVADKKKCEDTKGNRWDLFYNVPPPTESNVRKP